MKEERHEILDSKISLHDKHRFEIKLDVELVPGRKNVYHVETYFFVPRSLNVNPSTYPKAQFYNSTQKYIRFKTPQISLSKLTDANVDISPLNRVNRQLSALLSGDRSAAQAGRIYNELKLFGCVARAAVRDHAKFLAARLNTLCEGAADTKTVAFTENCDNFLNDIKTLVSKVRALRVDIASPMVPEKVRAAFYFFDEFLSIMLVEYLSLLLEKMRARPELSASLAQADAKICEIITLQNNYRRSMKYASIIEKGTENEPMVYRRSVLKKFISSALYLQIETSEWEGAIQFFFGIAAAVAMLFWAIVMVFAQRRFTNNSMPFIVIIVVSYIFKDRIKDWLKLWFVKSWTDWVADRKIDIKDPQTGVNIGMVKEAFSFVSDDKIPPEIKRRRNIDNITSIDEDGKPERVMRYEKEVTLYPDRITRLHERKKDLNDILRFNIVPLLSQADDPRVDYLHLDPDTNRLETLECLRFYHINVVTKYASRNSEGPEHSVFDRVRIVMSRDGISRLEKVNGS